jgi:hypothetical protein
MQFFIFDFALAFAALLGYRALIAVSRRRPAVVAVGAGITRSREFIQRPRAVRLKAVARQPVVPTRATDSERPRASIHRLINFW